MAFTVHVRPHHLHIEVSCVDHTDCPPDHWKGGRPDPNHPHHVEIDCSTGLVGYTRLTAKEIAKQAASAKEVAAAQKTAQEKHEKRLALIRQMAMTDPAYAALAEHLGIPLED